MYGFKLPHCLSGTLKIALWVDIKVTAYKFAANIYAPVHGSVSVLIPLHLVIFESGDPCCLAALPSSSSVSAWATIRNGVIRYN